MNAEWEQWDVQEKTAQANKRRIEGETCTYPNANEMNEEKEIRYVTDKGVSIARGSHYKNEGETEIRKGIPTDEWHRMHGLEPKADPKEKELYSIKDLDWILREDTIDPYVLTIFGGYRITEHTYNEPHTFRVLFGDHYPQNYITQDLNTLDEAKQAAQGHFNSKLKLCLNREL